MGRNDELPAGCARVRDDLSRFLDNDLTGRAATDVTAHLETCVGCRHEYDRLKAVRAALNALPAPSAAAMESARTRAFARLENVVRAEEATTAVAPAPRRSPFRFTSLLPVWRPAVATLAAAAVVGGLFFLLPDNGPQAPGSPPASASTAPLPGADEMSVLFDLHDSRAAGMTAEDPMLHRSRAADAHAALLDRADATASASL